MKISATCSCLLKEEYVLLHLALTLGQLFKAAVAIGHWATIQSFKVQISMMSCLYFSCEIFVVTGHFSILSNWTFVDTFHAGRISKECYLFFMAFLGI